MQVRVIQNTMNKITELKIHLYLALMGMIKCWLFNYNEVGPKSVSLDVI